jgi:hypothetical protein
MSKTDSRQDALAESLDRLRLAVASELAGREPEWTKAVGEACAGLEQALREHHVAVNGPDGAAGEIDETRPTLARRAVVVQRDQDNLLGQFAALCGEVQAAAAAGTISQLRPIRARAEHLLTDLQRNLDAENDLVQESVTTDIGVGD